MARNGKTQGALREARPASGDLVDRFIEGRLRAALFGVEEELHLGRLRIEGSLGRGGMGAILSAFDPVLDRHVAIKSLLPDRSEDREQLLREARLLAKLDDANVVSIYDVVEDDDNVYLVMEQIQGSDLRGWMAEQHSWREVVDLFVQIGKGLSAAHALGIAHCDVKPDNVVISEGRPRLIDFGLAHQRGDAPSHAGTPAYLAPERVAGGAGSVAADQYAFFASMVEAIEGARPERDQRWERMPRWLQKVARRGLDPDPARRFPDMLAAVSALQPASRRTRLIAAAAVFLVVSLAGVALTLALRGNNTESGVCRGAAAQLEGIWTGDTRATMKHAFETTQVADASAIWATVDKRLDAYASKWIDLRTQSCTATRVHKEQSARLMDYSMHCFDRQLLALASVTRLFAAPNKTVVERARKTVGGLADPAACVDPAALERAVPLPDDPDDRARLRALQRRYEELRNLDRKGEYKRALAASDALATDAAAAAYAPLTTRVLVLRGSLQVTLGELAAAEKTFRAAASAASRARDDKRAAEVWIRVIGLLAKQSRYDEALTLEPVAITSAERLPDDYETQAWLQNTLGGIYLAKARYKQAYKAYEKALALQRKIGTEGNPALAPAIGNLGLATWYMGDLRGAMSHMQTALDMALAELGPDHSRVAYIRQNVADLHRQVGEGDKARPHYLEVIRIWSATLGPDHVNLAYPYEQLALLAKQRGDFETARAHIAKALHLRETKLGANHVLVLQSLNALAQIELAAGTKKSLRRAERAVTRAVAMQRTLGEPAKRYAVYVLESRAQLAELRKRWRAALADRLTVLKLRRQTLGATHRDTGNSFLQVGRMFAKLGKLGNADQSFRQAQTIFDGQPGVGDNGGVAARQGRAAIALRQKKPGEAVALLEDALARATKAKLPRASEVRSALAKARDAAGGRARPKRR